MVGTTTQCMYVYVIDAMQGGGQEDMYMPRKEERREGEGGQHTEIS